MLEKVLAGLTIAVCAVLMVRLFIGERRRWRFDAWFLRAAGVLRRWPSSVRQRRHSSKAAEKAALQAIDRARKGEWTDNVYTPKSFGKPRKPH